MLPAVICVPFLLGAQPPENAQVDIGIVARDVDVGMVKDVMLPMPDIGAAADHVQRHRHQLVDPGAA